VAELSTVIKWADAELVDGPRADHTTSVPLNWLDGLPPSVLYVPPLPPRWDPEAESAPVQVPKLKYVREDVTSGLRPRTWLYYWHGV
jgi:hypothetical protein